MWMILAVVIEAVARERPEKFTLLTDVHICEGHSNWNCWLFVNLSLVLLPTPFRAREAVTWKVLSHELHWSLVSTRLFRNDAPFVSLNWLLWQTILLLCTEASVTVTLSYDWTVLTHTCLVIVLQPVSRWTLTVVTSSFVYTGMAASAIVLVAFIYI